MVADAAVFAVSPFIALYLRVDDIAGSVYLDKIINYLPVLLAVHFLAFFALQLYRRVWKYAGIHELLSIVGAATLAQLSLYLLAQAGGIGLPRSLYILCGLLEVAMIGGIRLSVRIASNKCLEFLGRPEKILIFGAGDVGSWIVKEIRAHYGANKKIVGFIDDDPKKLGCILNGVKCWAGVMKLKKLSRSMESMKSLSPSHPPAAC